jgi:hypothetical protein
MLVALAGYKEVGKSTVAKILIEEGFYSLPLMGTARDMIHSLGVPWENITGSKKNEPLAMLGGQCGRTALKTLSTEWARSLFGEDFWLKIWEHKYNELISFTPETNVVIEDMRLTRESSYVHEKRGIIIRIDRPGKGPETGPGGHRTEQEIDLIKHDISIVNDGDIYKIRNKVIDILMAYGFTPRSKTVDRPRG